MSCYAADSLIVHPKNRTSFAQHKYDRIPDRPVLDVDVCLIGIPCDQCISEINAIHFKLELLVVFDSADPESVSSRDTIDCASSES